MILIKRFNAEKYKMINQNFHEITKTITRENDKMIFESDDTTVLDFVNTNFEDYVETDLRLDAIEALIVGEQSTFSKIREALKL